MLSGRQIRREATSTRSRTLSHRNKAPSTQQRLGTPRLVGKIYKLKIEKWVADTWKREVRTRQ